MSYEELQLPPLAPDDKIATYLPAGSPLVMVVDPRKRVVELHDTSRVNRLGERGTIEHAALPGFCYSVDDLFGVLRRG